MPSQREARAAGVASGSGTLLALACALVTALVYYPALSNGFVSWDDPEVLLENLHIRRLSGDSLRWMLSTFHTGNWIPLTWLSHALVYRAAHLEPWGHHLVNIVLHAANTGLVFLVAEALFRRARERRLASLEARRSRLASAIAALLFGLHPLHVESVAWVTERKDVLYGLFFLLAMLAYLWNPPVDKRRLRLGLVALLFLLSLLSKPMAVTLPLVLLILDLWPLGRVPAQTRVALVEKAPLFAIAVASALVTMAAQSSEGAMAADDQVPPTFRAMNALHSLAFYLWKMLAPFELLAFYPIGRAAPPALSPIHLAAAAVVLGVSALCFWRGRGRRSFVSAAWLYYVATLLPVLGLVQVGNQLAADRYTYLPSLGPLLLLSAALATRPAGLAVAAAALLMLVPLSVRQIGAWKDSVTLWERVITAYPDVSVVAHTNLANAYHEARRNEAAVREFRRALAIGPPHAYVENGLGTALLDLGRTDDAVRAFEAALALEPRYAPAHRNLWFAWRAKADPARARAAAEQAVRVDPEYAEAWSSLGISQAQDGELALSERSFRRALELDPDKPAFLGNLATTLQRSGQLDEAIELYLRASALDPHAPVYVSNLARTYRQRGLLAQAEEAERRARALEAIE